MADLFRSAVNYFSGTTGDSFVGRVVNLGDYEVKVKRLLGGGSKNDPSPFPSRDKHEFLPFQAGSHTFTPSKTCQRATNTL